MEQNKTVIEACRFKDNTNKIKNRTFWINWFVLGTFLAAIIRNFIDPLANTNGWLYASAVFIGTVAYVCIKEQAQWFKQRRDKRNGVATVNLSVTMPIDQSKKLLDHMYAPATTYEDLKR